MTQERKVVAVAAIRTDDDDAYGLADYCTREGAEALKQRIEDYWRGRGMAVTIALANVGFHPAVRAARYELRSDMLNGFPRLRVARAPDDGGED